MWIRLASEPGTLCVLTHTIGKPYHFEGTNSWALNIKGQDIGDSVRLQWVWVNTGNMEYASNN